MCERRAQPIVVGSNIVVVLALAPALTLNSNERLRRGFDHMRALGRPQHWKSAAYGCDCGRGGLGGCLKVVAVVSVVVEWFGCVHDLRWQPRRILWVLPVYLIVLRSLAMSVVVVVVVLQVALAVE